MDLIMLKLTLILTVILPFEQLSSAFQPQRVGRSPFRVLTTRIESTTSASTANDDNAIQWELFRKYHLGKWKGVWTTYNYMGDVDIETIASVNVVEQTNEEASSKQQEPKIVVTHDIVKGAKTSDCTTCFDDYEIQSIPVATYTPGNLGKARLGACGMVVGPTVLRSGAMATELVLSCGDGRVRVVFQHAPVWVRDRENNTTSENTTTGTGPPDGLKLFRTMVSKEAKRSAPPTILEANNPIEMRDDNNQMNQNPVFVRPVPPVDWHKKWGGTCWTWGPEAGNRGWQILELEDADSWHGQAPVELWQLRLGGGVFLQTPRVITPNESAMLRLAWLPTPEVLLRIEVGVLALQEIFDDEEEDVVGISPPSLASLRVDVLQKLGDLEGAPSFVEDMRREKEQAAASLSSLESNIENVKSAKLDPRAKKDDKDDTSLQEIQNALQL